MMDGDFECLALEVGLRFMDLRFLGLKVSGA